MRTDTATFDVRLTDRPVTFEAVVPFPTSAGAECVFIGRTRLETHPEHGNLVRLTYESYAPMAMSVLEELAGEAASRFDCRAVRIHHALGDVPPGEGSVLVQVVCGHRAESFEACRFLIDTLKQRAPIWKREVWADGTTWAEGAIATDTERDTP